MIAKFAMLEARSVAASIKHLTNSVAVLLDTGAQVLVMFDNEYQAGLGSTFEASQPTVLGASADLQGLEHGSLLTLPRADALMGVDTWAVVGVQPDGTGLTRLMLERTT